MTDAWSLAHRAAATAGVRLAPLGSVDDARAIGDVIVATWGEQPIGIEVVRALAESGNQPYGAYDGDRLVAFVLGWAGVDGDRLHVHSHMLAALPDRRHAGVGFALKLAQRAQALDQGIHVARWTFDPLVARNAYFNLVKLGAVADRFDRDFYGAMGDELNRGDRTDRLTARWDLDPEPGSRLPVPSLTAWVLRRAGEAACPEPSLDLAALDAPLAAGDGVGLEVPPEYLEVRVRDPGLARAWRDATAEAFEACVRRGRVAAAFDRDASAYVVASETFAR